MCLVGCVLVFAWCLVVGCVFDGVGMLVRVIMVAFPCFCVQNARPEPGCQMIAVLPSEGPLLIQRTKDITRTMLVSFSMPMYGPPGVKIIEQVSVFAVGSKVP